MDWIKKRTHIIDHERFLEAGAIARDLYDWGMLWSGEHETDGEIPMVAVVTSAWGRGGRSNVTVAQKLIQVGLWIRTDNGFRILQWTEQGNLTKAQLAADRESARIRKASRGSGKVLANSGRTNTEVPTSTSLSLSSSGSLSQIASIPPEPDTGVRLRTDVEMPVWFEGSCDAAAMVAGPVTDRQARWAEYRASRTRKGWAMDHTDAVGWLSTVVRSERAKVATRPNGKHPVQSAEGRGWILPEELRDE